MGCRKGLFWDASEQTGQLNNPASWRKELDAGTVLICWMKHCTQQTRAIGHREKRSTTPFAYEATRGSNDEKPYVMCACQQ
jgi:hypothetical protein